MIPNQIPSAFDIFNKQHVEKTNNVRDFLGLKRINNSYAGMYGVDFCWETTPAEKSNYIPCLEKGCSFRGPHSMMDFHVKTVHEAGLESRFDVETEVWRSHRKQNFPKSCLVKSNFEKKGEKSSMIKGQKPDHRNFKKKVELVKEHKSTEVKETDPMLGRINKIKVDSDLLGLGALYGSSDEDEKSEEVQSVLESEFIGLPTPEELGPDRLKQRRNKFRFPILPQMDLQAKRQALMHPQRRYHETFNRKAKRPRLADLLLAEEIGSERNVVLQCIRYLVNRRFFDQSLAHVATSSIRPTERNSKDDDQTNEVEEVDDVFFDTPEEPFVEMDDCIIWSDEDL